MQARISPEMKTLCQKAAKIQGSTLTDFIANSVIEAAKRIVRESEFMEFTRRDRLAFVQALLQRPASPSAKLWHAAERFARIFPDG